MVEMQSPVLAAHRGTMILIFGILGLVVCFPFGVAAWIMGNKDLNEIRSGRMDPSGEGTTQAGRICGIIATILAVLGLAIGVIVFLLSLGAGLSGAR